MSDTARSYQTNSPVSSDGLDELFTGTELGSESQNQIDQSSSEPLNASAVEVLSTDEAAKRLGISTRAVIKRLKTGALTGYRDESKPRAEWRIYWGSSGSAPVGSGSFDGTVGGAGSEPVAQAAKSSSFDHDISKPSALDSQNSYLIELNAKLLDQIQVLTYRNGYLESQLSEREKDISELKLLTDSQRKQDWWARFTCWFFRSR